MNEVSKRIKNEQQKKSIGIIIWVKAIWDDKNRMYLE